LEGAEDVERSPRDCGVSELRKVDVRCAEAVLQGERVVPRRDVGIGTRTSLEGGDPVEHVPLIRNPPGLRLAIRNGAHMLPKKGADGAKHVFRSIKWEPS